MYDILDQRLSLTLTLSRVISGQRKLQEGTGLRRDGLGSGRCLLLRHHHHHRSSSDFSMYGYGASAPLATATARVRPSVALLLPLLPTPFSMPLTFNFCALDCTFYEG